MSMNLSTIERNKPYIFIDTCVIQAAGSKEKQKSDIVIKTLQEIGNDFRLAISEFTLFENLHGLWGKKAEEATKILNTYERKVVSDKVLLLASSLGGLYRDEKMEGIDSGDKIIAATSILENGFVLTENHKDYPSPFFLIEKYIPLTFMTSGKFNKTIDLAIYKSNTTLINRRIKEKNIK